MFWPPRDISTSVLCCAEILEAKERVMYRNLMGYLRAIAKQGLLLFAIVCSLMIGTSRSQDINRSASPGDAFDLRLPNLFPFVDPTGAVETYTTDPSGKVDLTGPFFQSLGTNGRTCATCHQPSDAWTVSAAHVKARF